MKLSPREIDHLELAAAGALAQRRLARGLRLNYPEAVALIASQMQERIRDGLSVFELMTLGKKLLGRRQVMPGVAGMIAEVQIEGTFPDGTKLLTVHSPIAAEDGDLEEALRGSFLPTPSLEVFATTDADITPGKVTPGEGPGIELNKGRSLVELAVTNTGDRPIQVGSHYHFIETNPALKFDRAQSYGRRLNIVSGSSVRFEPGESKTVTLVEIAGGKRVVSGNRLIDGEASPDKLPAVMEKLRAKGFSDAPGPAAPAGKPMVVPRASYASTFGPTTGDCVTLGDTGLVVKVEKDYTVYGDECKFGGGKVLREGMGQNTGISAAEALDVVITNALIIDASLGIVKADIGIKSNRIVGIGKAGNPDVMDGVTPGMVVGVSTEAIAGEKLIATAGGVDTHIHFICPQLSTEAIASGLTTLYGGGTGPAAGTSATTCTPAPSQVEMMLKATDHMPLNFGFSGKGNTSDPKHGGLDEVLRAGAAGFKLHEDWGTTPAVIDAALTFADKHDVAITIHTDTLNESGYVDDSIAAIKGRTIHTYHTEGAGGGHAPDIIKVCSLPNVLPSSTNPTRPFTVNTIDEHLDMLMVCHHLDKNIPEDVAFAESRIRGETIAAEDILHDIGAISVMSSDSQAMGRIGEVVTRTWQTAAKMKDQRGPLPQDASTGVDNFRAKRYVAKYTINPALCHGMGSQIGTLEKGKLADIVLWNFANFGAKPEMVIKGGTIAWAQMGDPNASIPTPQPVRMRPMFGAQGPAVGGTSIAFVSEAAAQDGVGERYGLSKMVVGVTGTRTVGKKDMVANDAMPQIEVCPETFEVKADGEVLTCSPATKLPLAQRYFLF